MVTSLLIVAVGWAIIAARLQKPRDRTLTRLAWSMFWLVVANAVAGGFTVWFELNPWMVATHFVLAMGLLAWATFTWHRARWSGGDGPRPTAASRGVAWALVVATAVLVLVGTLVTGSGPHAGDSNEVPRMGFDWTTVVLVHASFAVLVLVLAAVLAFRLRAEEGGRLALRRVGTFLLVLLAQLVVGITQSLIGLPELLVVVHVCSPRSSGSARCACCSTRPPALRRAGAPPRRARGRRSRDACARGGRSWTSWDGERLSIQFRRGATL